MDFKRIQAAKNVREKIDEYFERWQRHKFEYHFLLHLDVEFDGDLVLFFQSQMKRRLGGVQKLVLVFKNEVYLLDAETLLNGSWHLK